jgi:hypothetical protein
MVPAMETDTFVILSDGAGGYEARVRLADGGTLTGRIQGRGAAREWVAKHAPDAKEAAQG